MLTTLIVLLTTLSQWGLAIATTSCEGIWRNATGPTGLSLELVAAARNETMEEWRRHACPLRSFKVNSWDCFKTAPERAVLVSGRQWVPDEGAACKPFFPFHFLRFLEGKTMLMLGDSIMGQLYIHLVCSLIDVAEAEYKLVWASGHQQQGHFNSADVFFPFVNATVSFRKRWMYSAGDLERAVAGLTNLHLVVVNFGLHYNSFPRKPPQEPDPGDYRNALTLLSRDMGSFLTEKPPVELFLLETLPQHFAGSTTNGFYNFDYKMEGCRPIKNVSDDWRLSTMHSIKYPPGVKIIKVTEALYSQWDAHIEEGVDGDCSHWCFESAALRYVRLQIWNALFA